MLAASAASARPRVSTSAMWSAVPAPPEAYRGQAGEALVRELQDHVKRITAPYKYPRVIEFVESLPKTISGKIRRKEIRSGDEGK